jgi:hypothetical protein
MGLTARIWGTLSPQDRKWRLLAIAITSGWVVMTLRFFAIYRLKTSTGVVWGLPDDMYISADFGRTFIHGQGVRWFSNAPKVEGFSNPLWVLLLGLLQALPTATDDNLGLHLGVVDCLIMLGIGLAFVSAMRLACRDAPLSFFRAATCFVLCMCCCTILCFCTGVGFETGAVVLLSLLALRESLRKPEGLRPVRLAVFIGAAFWVRMDSLLICAAALVLAAPKLRPSRSVFYASAVLTTAVATQFLLRFWYFGDWVPNTFYLKATGWDFVPRITQGRYWIRCLLNLFAFCVLPLWALLRRQWKQATAPISAALLAYLLSISYSIKNGGDMVYVYGHDRFTGAGSIYLAFALACATILLNLRTFALVVCALVALAVSTGPMWMTEPQGGFEALLQFLDISGPALPQDALVTMWSDQGKLLRQFTRPGTTVALCGAGTLVYFSHRGGVDLLGKIEPYVAHQPVRTVADADTRCWRPYPGAGHNKEDVKGTFDLRHPDVSVFVPPRTHQKYYSHVRYKGFDVFARKNSRNINWRDVQIIP